MCDDKKCIAHSHKRDKNPFYKTGQSFSRKMIRYDRNKWKRFHGTWR